jgi:hypothetical protein
MAAGRGKAVTSAAMKSRVILVAIAALSVSAAVAATVWAPEPWQWQADWQNDRIKIARDGDALELTIIGGGTCPLVPEAVDVPDPGLVVIQVRLGDGSGICSADLGPVTSRVALPASERDRDELTVRVVGYTDEPAVIEIGG